MRITAIEALRSVIQTGVALIGFGGGAGPVTQPGRQ